MIRTLGGWLVRLTVKSFPWSLRRSDLKTPQLCWMYWMEFWFTFSQLLVQALWDGCRCDLAINRFFCVFKKKNLLGIWQTLVLSSLWNELSTFTCKTGLPLHIVSRKVCINQKKRNKDDNSKYSWYKIATAIVLTSNSLGQENDTYVLCEDAISCDWVENKNKQKNKTTYDHVFVRRVHRINDGNLKTHTNLKCKGVY